MSRLMGEWQSIFRVKLHPVLLKVAILLAAIRAVNWAQGDGQSQIGGPDRDRLATCFTFAHPGREPLEVISEPCGLTLALQCPIHSLSLFACWSERLKRPMHTPKVGMEYGCTAY
jgi:hypothetical protein